MYELTTIKEAKASDRPKIQRFKVHSPLLIGTNLYLLGREQDDKVLITSKIVDIFKPHENIFVIKTKNGSIYELKQI